MSGEATFWAWRQHAVKGNDKLVLLCYADYADDAGYAWPGKGTVSIKCGVSKPTVKRCVSRLVSEGYLINCGYATTKTSDSKMRDTIKYRLPIPGEFLTVPSGVTPNPVQGEPTSKDENEESASSGVTMNPVEGEDQKEQGDPKDSSGVKLNPVQNEPGSNCPSSGVTVNPNPTSNNPTRNIYKSIDLSVLPEGVSLKIAKEYIDHRKNIKSPVVQSTFDDIIKTAGDGLSDGFNPDQILIWAMGKGYRGLSLSWVRAAIEKDPELRKKIQPNAPQPEDTSDTTMPNWQKLGFNSQPEKIEYDGEYRSLKQLEDLPNPTQTDLAKMESHRKRLRELAPNPEKS